MPILHLLEDLIWSAVAATGFAMLFNVPRRTLIYCALLGGIGHLCRTVLHEPLGFDLAFSTLIGASVVGVIAHLSAHRLQVPPTVLSLPGVIPMIPGTFAYRAMIGFLRFSELSGDPASAVLVEAAHDAVQTLLILAAIAIGIVIPNLLIYRKSVVH